MALLRPAEIRRYGDRTKLRNTYTAGVATQEAYGATAFFDNLTLHRDLDAHHHLQALRVTEAGGNPEGLYHATYGYAHPDSGAETGRLTRAGTIGQTAYYRYHANSNLVQTITQTDGLNTRKLST